MVTWAHQDGSWLAHRPAVRRSWVAAPSKSATHRAYVLAALSDQPCRVRSPLRAADPDATLQALRQLGASATERDGEVQFQPSPLVPSPTPLDLANAGTGLRLLLALCATLSAPSTLTGDASLRSRSNAALLAVLREAGAQVEGGPCAPITIHGPVGSLRATLPGSASSQFVSALLLAWTRVPGDHELVWQGPWSSAGYVKLTLDALRAFQVHVDDHKDADRWILRWSGPQAPRATDFVVEGDWSTAAFHIVGGYLADGIRIRGLRRGSKQADARILTFLEHLGATFSWEGSPEGEVLHVPAQESNHPKVTDLVFDMAASPDLFPVLVVLAASLPITTTFTGGASLRHKETDRIEAMARMLTVLGVDHDVLEAGLVVRGTGNPFQGGTIECCHDHRIHMAACVASLRAKEPLKILQPESVRISHPTFHESFAPIQGPPMPRRESSGVPQ